jgi:hypothetical protein
MRRFERMRRRDWRDPFSWFNWYHQNKPETLFKWAVEGGRETGAMTFARADASTCATYIDSAGIVQTVAANVPRYLHYPTAALGPALLLEGSRQNISGYSSDGGAACVNWVLTNQTGAMDATGPDGIANSAATLTATAAGNYSGPACTTTLAASTGLHTLTRWIKRGNTDWVWVGDSQDGIWHRCSFNLASSTCVKGTEVNCTGSVLYAGTNGWYRVQITYNSTNTYTPRVVTGTATSTSSFSGTIGDTVLVWGAQLEKLASFASSYIPTTSAAVTRAADSLSFAFPYAPQAMTVYADFVEGGAVQTVGNKIFVVGNGTAAPYLDTRGYTGQVYTAFHHNGTSVVSSVAAATPTLGQRVELRTALAATGTVTLGQSINGASEVVAATSGTNTLAAAWSGSTVLLGTVDVNPSFLALRKFVVAAGVQSLATMRSL